jgi:DNA-binding NarL/FixJ family response regulator
MTRQVPRRDVLFDAIGSGVRGWVTVDLDPRRLPAVLADVLAGNVALPRPAVTDLVHELRKRNSLHVVGRDGRAVRLSAQEHRTLHLLSTGLSTADAAERMQVACVTVRGYVASACRKLGATSRADALEVLAR